MLTFIAAVFFFMITPGPGVLSAAGVGSGFGFRPGITYLTGLFIGNGLVAISVVMGIAAVLELYPPVRLALFVASAIYLTYLAAKIAFAGTRIAFIHAERPPGLWGGVMLQVINPKCYLVNMALFSGFPFLASSLSAEILVKAVIISLFWIPIHLFWLSVGVFIRRLDLPHRIQFAINLGMAAAMLLVVGLAAVAQT